MCRVRNIITGFWDGERVSALTEQQIDVHDYLFWTCVVYHLFETIIIIHLHHSSMHAQINIQVCNVNICIKSRTKTDV